MQDFPCLECRISFLNAGIPFSNAGFPFLNAGFPSSNAGFPFLNTGLPFLKTIIFPFWEQDLSPDISRFWQVLYEMVFGHNLHYMAPFGIPRPGFCMVFQRASFVFHAQGRFFEPRIGFWILRSTFWPGDLFGVKTWSRKKSEFVTESFCHGSSGEISKPK